jgi:hypothetical protein
MVYVWNPIFSYVDIDNQNDIKPLLNQEDQQEETPMEQNKIKSQSSFDSANTQRQKTNKTLITLIENQIIQARLDGLYSVIISQPVISAEVKDYFVSDPLNYKFGYTPEGAIKFFW